MSPRADPSALSRAALQARVTELRGEVVELKRLVAALRDENVRLKGPPVIKPSGMEDATRPKRQGKRATAAVGVKRRHGSPSTQVIHVTISE